MKAWSVYLTTRTPYTRSKRVELVGKNIFLISALALEMVAEDGDYPGWTVEGITVI